MSVVVGGPNELDQPDPNFDPNFDPEGPTQPKNGSGRVQIGYIKYIIGLNPNLNPF